MGDRGLKIGIDTVLLIHARPHSNAVDAVKLVAAAKVLLEFRQLWPCSITIRYFFFRIGGAMMGGEFH